jgi:hypothetical protein
MVKINFKNLSNDQHFELEVVIADLGTVGQLKKLAAEKAGLAVADVQLVSKGNLHRIQAKSFWTINPWKL